MKQEILNYEALIVHGNEPIKRFEFHGDNAELATDHIQHVANCGYDGLTFDHIEYKNKANVKWKVVRPINKQHQDTKELFTGGDWYIEKKQGGCAIWSDVSTNGSDRTIVASIWPVNKEANAALLASAPAMYRALQEAEIRLIMLSEADCFDAKDSAILNRITDILNKIVAK